MPSENIYYDVKSRHFFRLSSIENVLINKKMNGNENQMWNLKSSVANSAQQGSKSEVRRLAFRSNGCTCQQLTCGCCLGINLNQFQFNREGCMNFTYDPQEFAVTMEMIMDENTVFTNSFSAKNPPPLCIPVPIPYIPIQVETCAKLFDIHTPGQNLHMCFDFETRIQGATVLILHFDCMRMGTDGVALLKPGESVGGPFLTTTPESSQLDADVYDQVTEIKRKSPKN
ncbi:uncharacterized protein LOC132695775 [Cylas formicarius]|uniref:uncharacterized protein LOC132695775 n=1 Tax=Cylas formicarius TaxID=197179 RepID=UPI002958D151|nr:uncharacterized protein LOC132695775 [Cylas formicarius]